LAPPTDKPLRAAGSRSLRRAPGAAVVLSLILAPPAQASIFGPEPPHSPNAEAISIAYWAMLVIGILLAVVIHVALIRAVVRSRADRDRRPVRETAGRGMVGRAIAALGALAVAVLVFGIVMTVETRSVESSGPEGLGAQATRFAQVGLRDLPASEATEGGESAIDEETAGSEPATGQEPSGVPVEIDAIGQQWLWRFEYPGNDPQGSPRFSYGELLVPVDTPVILNVTSTDVMHTWWIPSLGGQVQAVPGDISQTWFKADEEGVYEGPSTTFSGTNFPAMRAWVRAVSAEDYTSYVEELERELTEAQEIVEEEVREGAGAEGVAP
jgi:heme/copper-type cytochrome/quinol oxidase subunit 2